MGGESRTAHPGRARSENQAVKSWIDGVDSKPPDPLAYEGRSGLYLGKWGKFRWSWVIRAPWGEFDRISR